MFCVALLGGSHATFPAAPDKEGIELFRKKILPVLEQHCYECHSAKADDLKGNLRLDTREGMLKGGDNGPAVKPGDVEDSFLFKAMSYKEDDYKMPPKGKLPDEVLKDFERWIKIGAPDPREDEKDGKDKLGVRRRARPQPPRATGEGD